MIVIHNFLYPFLITAFITHLWPSLVSLSATHFFQTHKKYAMRKPPNKLLSVKLNKQIFYQSCSKHSRQISHKSLTVTKSWMHY